MVASQWIELANKAEEKIITGNLYLGRAIQEIKRAAEVLDAQLAFASTGFGLIDAETTTPNYDLTVSDSQETIHKKIVGEAFSAPKWWSCVNQLRGIKPLSTRLAESPGLTILFALPKAYLELIHQELANISKEDANRLRIFTSPKNANALPESVRSAYIPYDERFDGEGSPIPGTRSDYPQRVLRHFAESIIAPNHLNLEAEKARILQLLGGMAFRPKVERVKLTNEDITEVIIQNWDKARGSAAHMLRMLRDDLHIACEQGRFGKIFGQVKQEKTPHLFKGTEG